MGRKKHNEKAIIDGDGGTNTKYRIITTIILIAIIVFIFSRSAAPAVVSDVQSKFVLEELNGFFAFAGIRDILNNHIVRKLAHFVEYAALGFWLILTLRAYTEKIKRYFYFPAAAGIIVPIVDECIQLFSPGRSAQISDVLLDCCGVIFGISAMLVILRLHKQFFA